MQELCKGMYISIDGDQSTNLARNFRIKCTLEEPKELFPAFVYAAYEFHNGHFNGYLATVKKAIFEVSKENVKTIEFLIEEYIQVAGDTSRKVPIEKFKNGESFSLDLASVIEFGKTENPALYAAFKSRDEVPLTIKAAIARLADTYETQPKNITIGGGKN